MDLATNPEYLEDFGQRDGVAKTLKTRDFSHQVAFVRPDSYHAGERWNGSRTLTVSPAVDTPAILSYLS